MSRHYVPHGYTTDHPTVFLSVTTEGWSIIYRGLPLMARQRYGYPTTEAEAREFYATYRKTHPEWPEAPAVWDGEAQAYW